MTIVVYGIKNCDTVKKACAWFKYHEICYRFHDYKVDGITVSLLDKFLATLDWKVLLNKRSTTWRQLANTEEIDLDIHRVRQLFLEYPALIKRPVIQAGDIFIIGFNAEEYRTNYESYFRTVN